MYLCEHVYYMYLHAAPFIYIIFIEHNDVYLRIICVYCDLAPSARSADTKRIVAEFENLIN